MSVEEIRIGGRPLRTHVVERRYVLRKEEPDCSEQRGASESPQGFSQKPLHGAGPTTTASLGTSPSISGAYMASTRVAGSRNVPGLFKRTVYSTTHEPFGTNR